MNDTFLNRAILLSRESLTTENGGPFGAVVVKNGEIIAEAVNLVTKTNDPTAHAEVGAIRKAAATLNTFDLSGCELYTSCEPCPMCFGAIYWSRIGKVYYANTRKAAASIGFDDDFIYKEINQEDSQKSVYFKHIPSPEARQVFADWTAKQDKIVY